MKLIETFINGVKSFYDVDNEVIYHYTNSMIENACCIKVEPTFMRDEVQEMFSVQVLEEDNAYSFVMYWDEPLAPLVLRRMIKDVVIFQKYKSKDIFIEFLKEMSVQYTSSAMQSIEGHRDEMFAEVTYDLGIIEEVEENRRNEKINP
jgi:hypothetical protein